MKIEKRIGTTILISDEGKTVCTKIDEQPIGKKVYLGRECLAENYIEVDDKILEARQAEQETRIENN